MPRILIIDDDRQIRSMVQQTLRRAGYEVMEAQNGLEGIHLFRTAPADLVITDILMPEKEGLETIQELRQLAPQVKIIAISGGGEQGNFNFLRIAEKLGAQQTIRKPFVREDLIGCVAQVLRGPHEVSAG